MIRHYLVPDFFHCIGNCVVACDKQKVFVSRRAQFGWGNLPFFFEKPIAK